MDSSPLELPKISPYSIRRLPPSTGVISGSAPNIPTTLRIVFGIALAPLPQLWHTCPHAGRGDDDASRGRQHKRSTPHALLNVIRLFDSLFTAKTLVLPTRMHLTPFGLILKCGDRDETVAPRAIPRSMLHVRMIT